MDILVVYDQGPALKIIISGSGMQQVIEGPPRSGVINVSVHECIEHDIDAHVVEICTGFYGFNVVIGITGEIVLGRHVQHHIRSNFRYHVASCSER